jgi:formylmethanofuran dehydrogenase subunit E
MQLVSKGDLPLEVLLKSIEEAGRQMLSCTPVRVVQYYGKIKKSQIEICSKCGEAYPASQGAVCLSCQGKGYYEPLPYP